MGIYGHMLPGHHKNYMKPIQSGFTLIEMMIALAIIGIISAIGIDSYIDYTKRSHAAEGLLLSDEARLSVLDYFNSYNRLPANNEEAGLSSPEEYTGNAVASIQIEDGDIIITYNEKVIDGDTIVYEITANTSITEWDCTGGTLLNDYRPSNCR